jgi:hypothetical protein
MPAKIFAAVNTFTAVLPNDLDAAAGTANGFRLHGLFLG